VNHCYGTLYGHHPFTPEQALKDRRRNRSTAILFL